MNNNPLVTVLLPCYNAELYVEEAVRSMMQQTYTNLEILLIDDCSTDGTNAILSRLALEDNRIRLVRNEPNLKLIKTLNKGLDLANGIYIARMDADDISLPVRIEKQMNFMLSNPEVDLCGTNYIMIDGEGLEIGCSDYPLNDIRENLLFNCPVAHPSVLFKKETIIRVGKYNEEMFNAEDYELWLRVVSVGCIKNISDKLLLYRWHGNNISLIGGIGQNIDTIRLALKTHKHQLGFPLDFIDYHAKSIAVGGWKTSTAKEINGFYQWEKALLFSFKDNAKTIIQFLRRKQEVAVFCVLKNHKFNSVDTCFSALFFLIKNPIRSAMYFFIKLF